MFSDPLKNLKAFGIRETDVVADLGAGTGYYAILAAHIASKGKVYAIEIAKDFLETIANKAKSAKLSNIECLRGDVEKAGGTKIGDKVADKAIASNIFFQTENKENFIEEIGRILKDRGEVLVIDWSDESELSSALSQKGLIVPKETMKRMFEQKGFRLEREVDAGIHHYGMIFIKNQ